MDKTIAIRILIQLYEDMHNTFEYDYETVDSFYAYLGYNLELHHELPSLGIHGTSDLQEAMLKMSEG